MIILLCWTNICVQNLDSLPIANELPIVNTLCITHTWTNTCRTKLLLLVAKIHPIASTRVTDRTNAQMSELLLSEQYWQSYFRVKQLKHKSTLLSINEDNSNKGLTDIFKRIYCRSNMWSIRGCYKRNNLNIYDAPEQKLQKFIQAFKASYSEYPESKKFKRALNTLRVILLLSSCTLCI